MTGKEKERHTVTEGALFSLHARTMRSGGTEQIHVLVGDQSSRNGLSRKVKIVSEILNTLVGKEIVEVSPKGNQLFGGEKLGTSCRSSWRTQRSRGTEEPWWPKEEDISCKFHDATKNGFGGSTYLNVGDNNGSLVSTDLNGSGDGRIVLDNDASF